jgi:ABC-type Fe3+/spermidine/putrescine transport system ATPase subunit
MKALASVRMDGYETRAIHELSGGQQQRIALARALAIEPEVLLLDEPLSNLDPSLREDLRDEIRNVIHDQAVTTVFVTHDQQEAFALADRIVIMNAGICRQEGTPEDVYNHPADSFVARFLGKANLLPARCVGMEGDACLLEVATGIRLKWQGKAQDGLESLMVFIRPENIIVRAESSDALPPTGKQSFVFPASIVTTTFEGAMVGYVLDLAGVRLNARAFHHGQSPITPGTHVGIQFTDFQVLPSQ